MIRIATEADIPRLVEIGHAMHEESPSFHHLDYDEAKVALTLRHCMTHGVVLVHYPKDGVIDGGFVGLLVERWFGKDEMFTDLALFLLPSARGGLAAARLIRAAVAWCRDRGMRASDVQLGVSTGVHPEQTGALYERLNFERFGGLYRLRGF